MLHLNQIDQTWTLFLDRDGVINHEKYQDYVYNYDEFVFYEGAKEALQILSEKFYKLIIITNQRGIGRGLMSEEHLHEIHYNMVLDIKAAAGRIDKIYYCISTDNAHSHRKPNPGMAYDAKKDFPAIEFAKSIIAGNNLSDMEFGRNAGMYTVFIKTTSPDLRLPHPLIDLAFDSLYDFAKALQTG